MLSAITRLQWHADRLGTGKCVFQQYHPPRQRWGDGSYHDQGLGDDHHEAGSFLDWKWRGLNGTLNLEGGIVTVNNWFAVGRDSGTGTLNMRRWPAHQGWRGVTSQRVVLGRTPQRISITRGETSPTTPRRCFPFRVRDGDHHVGCLGRHSRPRRGAHRICGDSDHDDQRVPRGMQQRTSCSRRIRPTRQAARVYSTSREEGSQPPPYRKAPAITALCTSMEESCGP